jgi:hypothetical protein
MNPSSAKTSVNLLSASVDSRGIEPKKLPQFEDLLWEWISIQERSIRLTRGEDAMWWYGERACLGGFSGAVWRSGGFVLEEYSTEKLHMSQSPNGTKEKSMGRGDMDFVMGGSKYTIEAKICWPTLGGKSVLNNLKNAMNSAELDVKRVKAYKGYSRLAIVFASPRCGKGKDSDALVTDWIAEIRGLRGWTCAWVFPALGRQLIWADGRKYPGAALFIKYAGGTKPPTYKP